MVCIGPWSKKDRLNEGEYHFNHPIWLGSCQWKIEFANDSGFEIAKVTL